jgi:hypothetical protein
MPAGRHQGGFADLLRHQFILDYERQSASWKTISWCHTGRFLQHRNSCFHSRRRAGGFPSLADALSGLQARSLKVSCA